MTDLGGAQRVVAVRFGVEPQHPVPGSKVGIAANVRDGLVPLNALRHAPVGDTSGWYVWAGEVLSGDDDFFLPVHVEHLAEWCPELQPYLALPPGWRVLIAPGYEDVWFDPSLLDVQ